MLRLGIIVCAHGNSKAVKRLCKQYTKNKVDVIAICGDLGDDFKEINSVLGAVPKKTPVIAFPGSHEPAKDYYRAIKKHKKIIDGTKKRRITIQGYDIITLPGSGVNTQHANFRIIDEKRLLKQFLGFKTFLVKELTKYVRKPSKTIVLCHDPPKGSLKQGIDVAYSGIVTKNFIAQNKKSIALFAKKEIITQPEANKLARKGFPVKVANRNVGNQVLKKVLQNKKIPFFACGHIHEAGQRAVSATGKSLKQGKWNKSVWYNAAPAKQGKGGILIIDNGKGTFKNIKVKA